MNKRDEFNIMVQQYIASMRFTEGGPDNPEFEKAELASEAMTRVVTDCKDFLQRAEALKWRGHGHEIDDLAHDFWLTRNGHGAGFWDGDWPEQLAEDLTTLANTYGEAYPYVGDDGLIYFTRS